jgi:hypothetical protein
MKDKDSIIMGVMLMRAYRVPAKPSPWEDDITHEAKRGHSKTGSIVVTNQKMKG